MRLKLITALLALTILSPSVTAETPSFNYFELTYSSFNRDSYFDFEANGVGFNSAFELSENIFIKAEFKSLSAETIINLVKSKFDSDFTNLGLGYQMELGNSSIWYASIETSSMDTRVGVDIDSFRIGVRSILTAHLELNGSVAAHTLDFGTSMDGENTGLQIGLSYKISEDYQVTADYERIEDFNIFNLGVAISF